MSHASSLVRTLLTGPGCVTRHPESLLARAAVAHAELLSRAADGAPPELARALAPLLTFWNSKATAIEKRRAFCHPLFIEGLHALSPCSRTLQRWHDCVTSNPRDRPSNAAATAALGTVALAVRLHTDRTACGRFELLTDVLGRLGFPFCDWSLQFFTDDGSPLAGQIVTLSLDGDRAVWRLGDARDHEIAVMPRWFCVRMLVDNNDDLDAQSVTLPDPRIHLKLSWACPIGRSPIRYDPVGIPAGTGHSGVTGGLIARIVAAIRRDSPSVYREFRTFIRAIRGFEFARSSSIASFSDPTLPGIMGLSVAYTPDGEPCLDPLCFTWFGHEMGHTKDYLCDTVLYAQGESLATNITDWSAIIPRYGRPLSVRTLIQIPYVHLYEWALLMDFQEHGFAGLPWTVHDGVAAAGNDYAAEIEESFDLIDRWADLTETGIAAMDYFRELFDDARERWESLHVVA